MHDGALFHSAKSVKQWLRDCFVPFLEDWPVNSLDLNRVENLWAIKNGSYATMTAAKLRDMPDHLRNTFTPQHLMVLADSIPARLNDCTECQGKPVKY